jgi:type VI secretion system secreted protein Hcp
MDAVMNWLVKYAAVLVIGVVIGSVAFYAWTQFSGQPAARSAAYTEYGESGAMTYKAFLSIADIVGSSLDAVHPDEIEVLEFAWGEMIDADALRGAGAGAVAPEKEDFTFVFWWDTAACTDLLEACTKGQHISEAVFSVRSPALSDDFLVVQFQNVIISSFQTHGTVFEGPGPLCEIRLAFTVITVRTYEFSERAGAFVQRDEFQWNYETHTSG